MSSLSQQLCNFADATKFEDLPQDVINEAKRLIMDSIASAFAGIGSDKGKFAIELSQKLGSGNESSIIGARGKTSSSSAAFANGELVNAIDIDAFESPHGHFPPFVIPSILALAESKGASGKDLILATALGCEVARRVDSGMTPASAILDPKRGEHSLTLGNSHFIFGGVVGSSKILKQNQEKMINAFGIAGHFCPVPSERKFQETIPIPMTKYGSSGFVSMGAVVAAVLADTGFYGDATILDGDYGFWRMYGYGKWEPEKVTGKLGETWAFLGISYKLYPAHRAMHAIIECFVRILNNNNLKPEDIESVKAYGHPPMMRAYRGEQIVSHADVQSNIRYCLACAAYGIPIEDWQIWKTLKDPRILAFTQKVSSDSYPDWRNNVAKDPISKWSGAVDVVAKGKTYKEDMCYPTGTANTPVAITNEQLVTKYRNAASRVLPKSKIDKATKYLLELETVPNVREIMKQVVL